MRNATQEEIDQRKKWTICLSFTHPDSPNKKRKKKLGPFAGSKQNAIDQALQTIAKNVTYTTEFTVEEDDVDEEYNEDIMFSWDWKRCPSEDFFEKLDKQLSPFGCEVVNIEFDGDAYLWFVGKKQ